MSRLRRSLLGNGLFSVASGLTALLLSRPLSAAMSVSSSILYVVGGAVFAFGAWILWWARQPRVDERFAFLVVALDLLWLVVAVVLIAIPASLSGTGRLILVVATLVVALFAVLQVIGLIAASREEPRRLVAEIHIADTPDSVWASLTDLDSYADWNPFITGARGEVCDGSALTMRMEPPGGPAMSFTPTVTMVDVGRTFEWLGSLGMAGIFDGRHRFTLEPNTAGTCVTQSEEFTGLLVPLMWKTLDTKTRAGFESMNLALKGRVEGGVRNST